MKQKKRARIQGTSLSEKAILAPEAVLRIAELLKRVGKRVKLAAAVDQNESRISEWLGGRRAPTPGDWIRLGKLALELGLAEPFFFWGQAGIDSQTLRAMTDEVVAGQYRLSGETVPISRYRETLEGREEAGSPILLPGEFVPNPMSTVCLVVDHEATAVVHSPDAIFVVDESEKGTRDLRSLWNQVVFVTYAPDPDATAPHAGIYMGRLGLAVHNRPTPDRKFSASARLRLLGRSRTVGVFPSSPWILGRFEYSAEHELAGIDPLDDSVASDPRMVATWMKARDLALTGTKLGAPWSILGTVLGRFHLEGSRNE